MKTKNLFTAPLKHIVAAGVLSAFASSASALVPLDGWQLDTTNGGVNTATSLSTNIGHLVLEGGLATVEQEVVDIGGGVYAPFVGAEFSELGQIFSARFIPENCVGLCDSGLGADLTGDLDLKLVFDGLSGTVASFDPLTGRIEYNFTAGEGSVVLQGSDDAFATFDELASFSVVNPSGGDLGDFNGIGGQSQGQSTISALVATAVSDLFRDSLGTSLDAEITAGDLFALVVTTNQISDEFGNLGECSFNDQAQCLYGDVTSVGTFDLLTVPVPAPLALLGLGLVLLGVSRRKQSA